MNTRSTDSLRIAVTGAAGRIGGQVVDLLARQTTHEIIAVTRRRQSPAAGHGRVVTVVADYADPSALRAALHGVDTLVLVSSDGPVAQVLMHHQNLIRAATDSGVRHIVALSGLDADPRSPFCYAVSYAYTEQFLGDSGCRLSIARASIFTEFFLSFPPPTGGELRLPAGDARISLVSRDDVARCLAALAAAPPTDRHHDITGPEPLDADTVAALAAQAWGVEISYAAISPAEYCQQLARAGEDPWWIYAYATMFDSIRQHRWTAVSDEVQRLTGRSATSVRAVLALAGGPGPRAADGT